MKNHYLFLTFTAFTFLLIGCNNSDNDNPNGDSEELNLNVNVILGLVNDHRASGATCGSGQNNSVGTLV